jgi:magnesium-transporting ATPase (P-type)
MILLNSSDPSGACYVETKLLDGETSLKHRVSKQYTRDQFVNENEISNEFSSSSIECEEANEFIYAFQGKLVMQSNTYPIEEEQILLRGSSLRNTEWVYGVAIYVGHDTKIMMNTSKSKSKQSKMEKALNRYIVYGISIQTLVCAVSACYGALWLNHMRDKLGSKADFFYINLDSGNSIALDIIQSFF